MLPGVVTKGIGYGLTVVVGHNLMLLDVTEAVAHVIMLPDVVIEGIRLILLIDVGIRSVVYVIMLLDVEMNILDISYDTSYCGCIPLLPDFVSECICGYVLILSNIGNHGIGNVLLLPDVVAEIIRLMLPDVMTESIGYAPDAVRRILSLPDTLN